MRVVTDGWNDGTAYEAYVGRWSRLVAVEFLQWLNVPPGGTWLDFGCGTGALTQQILATVQPRRVLGCDRAAAYAAFASAQIRDGRAAFVTADLSNLPRVDGGFDAAVSGLVLNFLPSPDAGVSALAARVRWGGVVAAYVWDYAEGMQMMRIFWDAVCTYDPGARELDEGVRFPLCRPTQLRETFERAGVLDVDVQPIDIDAVFRGFEDFWAPFLGGQGPAPSYLLGLPVERRERIRELVASQLPIDSDGTIALKARAWAVKGTANRS